MLEWSQVPRIDCSGTFSPVCRLQSIRMVFANAAELDYEVYTLDVETAFLNADEEKEAVFCSNMMLELGFKKRFGSVPLHIDNTSALHVAGNNTYRPRAKLIALRYFFVQELVEEDKITIRFVKHKTKSPISEPSTPTRTVTLPLSSSSGNSRRKRQGDSVRRGSSRLYAGLENSSILIGLGVFFPFSWTWNLHQRTCTQ